MRARIKVGILLAKLDKDATGVEKLTEGQRASIKLLIDKAMPTLQAVETVVQEPAVTRSEAELLQELKAVLSRSPDLTQQALAELAKEQQTELKSA